ncbi:MAG: FlgD immunoglobulin-like domain containing protein [Candidatus Eisenbacteria bacterium]
MFNQTEIAARADFYQVVVVPTFRYDGVYIEDLFGTPKAYPEFMMFFRQIVDSLLLIPSPIRINMDQAPSADWDSVYVSFDVVAVDPLPQESVYGPPVLYLAVSEEFHRYAVPVGKWYYAFRDMVPDGDGYPLALEQGDSLHFDWSYPVDPIYNQDQIITTIFVETAGTAGGQGPMDSTHVVLQAASAKIVDQSSVFGSGGSSLVWLGRNAPNPFGGETRIAYQVSRGGNVRLSVYTPTGRLVTHLVDTYVEPGSHSATWDGRDRSGRLAGSGIYYYRLETEGATRTGRMVLLR